MNLVWAAVGAGVGLVAGAALRGAVFRLSVPSGEPDRATCPRCAGPLRSRLVMRCAHCGRRPGTPLVLELATAAVVALMCGRFGGQPEVVPFAFLATLGVALAAIDIAVQRLPDRLTLPAYPVLITLLAVSAVMEGKWSALGRALLGGATLSAVFLLMALARPGGLGGGDVKLAGLAGLALGWLGWPTLLFGAALGFLLSAVGILALLAARRITLRGDISFGPFLLGGVLLAILVGG